MDPFEHRTIIMILSSFQQALYVPFRLPPERHERLHLACKQKSLMSICIVEERIEQGFDSKPISSCKKALSNRIIQNECEFATKVVDEV